LCSLNVEECCAAPEKISSASAWNRLLAALQTRTRGVRIGSMADTRSVVASDIGSEFASAMGRDIAPAMQVISSPDGPAAM
jgi:hypothetical protein